MSTKESDPKPADDLEVAMSPKQRFSKEIARYEATQALADAALALWGPLSLVTHRLPPMVASKVPALQQALETWVALTELEEPESEGTRFERP